MGFLRRLFGAKKSGPPSDGSGSKSDNKKRRWSFVKHSKSLPPPPPPPPPSALTHFDLDANKHAIAVAAATAAVAEAALAAAHAAAEVVRLTSGVGVAGSSTRSRTSARVGQTRLLEETAAVKIQSAFRSYLARRALRALKALVKLQALVRGHIVRKQTSDILRRMQTLVRLQAQARASRAHLSDNVHSFKSSLSHYPVPEEYEHTHRPYSSKFDGSSILKRCSSNANINRNTDSERARFGSNWLDHWMEDNNASLKNNGHPDHDEKSDKILEVDTFNVHRSSNSFHTAQQYHYLNSDHNNNNNNENNTCMTTMAYESPSKRSAKALPIISSLKGGRGEEVVVASSRTADNSPQVFSASYRTGNAARRGPFTPTRSECSWGNFFGGYPNYMANTESSRAKVRSQSAPRQRVVEFERYGGSSRRAFQGLWDQVGLNSERDSDSRSNKVSPASSRFNRIVGSDYLR